MTTRRPFPLAHAAGVAGLLLATACAGDKTGYVGPYQSEVRRAIPQVEESTGLTFRTPPTLEVRTRDEVRAFLERQFNEQVTPLELAGTQDAYRLFGLIPDTLDLRAFLLAVLGEQVAGYYDPATKVLYVLADATPEMRRVTISHELVHALQDQYVRLDSVQSLKGDNDRQVAMQADIEGYALYKQLAAALGGADLGLQLPGGWDRVRDMLRSEKASMPIFANAPTLIQELLLFPYLSGAEFNRQFSRARPGSQPWDPFPSSTEQILHPERYLDSVPDLPTRVTLGAPRTGTLVYEQNLGEFETRLFLFEHLKDAGLASRAAEGWDGDRYQVVNTPRGAGIAWVTVWDSPVEAAEFRDAMEQLIDRRYKVAANTGGATPLRRWTAAGRHLLLSAETIDGRPVVVFEDMPAAITQRVLAMDKVKLEGGQ
jgi:hypothetical protein